MTKKKSGEVTILPINDIDEYLDHLWYELGDIRNVKYTNELTQVKWDDKEAMPELVVELARDPDYLHFVVRYILGIDLLPFQVAILQQLWTHPLPLFIASRGASKSFLLSIYLILRCLLHQGCKFAVVGAALRQSLVLFQYVTQIWENAPILRDICGGSKNIPKRELHAATWKCGLSTAMFLPMGTGDKIRGLRANYILADEIASISPEIFETVVRGFAAVKSDGLHGHVVKAYKSKAMKEMGLIDDISDEDLSERESTPTMLASNQIIMAGTAHFQFNHTYKYYKYYKAVIMSGGSKKKIKDEFPDITVPDVIRPQDYCLIRLPYAALPAGMMDETILNQGKATMDPAIFNMEYNGCFPADSEGFYLASQIRAATAPIQSSQGTIAFGAKLYGDKQGIYTMGIDPASENDNFAVHIIEINDNYNGSVYQWSTNRKTFEELQRLGAIDPDIKDYNTFVMWHIRSLLKRFNVSLIACDAGGGGLALRELFKDPDKIPKDELPILDMDDENTERMQGQRILKMVEFSNYQWRREAHYGLKKDIMDKKLVFPQYDLAAIEAANASDRGGTSFDTVEDCYLELEQCKSETMMIRHTSTATGQEKWDVPRMLGIDSEEMRKRLKKDRFTSLLLANWAARLVIAPVIGEPRNDEGVLAQAAPKNYASYAPCVVTYNPSTNLSRKIFY